jgi:hypothetical protein
MDEPKDHPSDASLEAISRDVDDVRDELHSSLADIRTLVAQSREAVFRMESALATSDPGASLRVAEVVDGVRAIAERTRKRQVWRIGAVAVQAFMLVIAITLIVLMRGDVQRGPVISSDVTVESAQTLSVVGDAARTQDTRLNTPPSVQDDTKHRRRRHH